MFEPFLLRALAAGLGVALIAGVWAALWSGGAWPILATLYLIARYSVLP